MNASLDFRQRHERKAICDVDEATIHIIRKSQDKPQGSYLTLCCLCLFLGPVGPTCPGFAAFDNANCNGGPGLQFALFHDVTSASDCCNKCKSSPDCTCWTWQHKEATTFSNNCALNKGQQNLSPFDSYTSGLPNGMSKGQHQFSLTYSGSHAIDYCYIDGLCVLYF